MDTNGRESSAGQKMGPLDYLFRSAPHWFAVIFEVGFVLLVPIALVIAKKVELPILRVALPC